LSYDRLWKEWKKVKVWGDNECSFRLLFNWWALTLTTKHLMQKIQLNLLKDGESRLNCLLFPLDGAFESSRKKKQEYWRPKDKDTLDALKSKEWVGW
jgi:hypothetical protein